MICDVVGTADYDVGMAQPPITFWLNCASQSQFICKTMVALRLNRRAMGTNCEKLWTWITSQASLCRLSAARAA